MDIRRTGAIQKGDEVIGNDPRQGGEEQGGAPFREAHFDIPMARHFPRGETSTWASPTRSSRNPAPGTPINGEKIAGAKDNAREFLRESDTAADREQGPRCRGVAVAGCRAAAEE